MKRDVVWRTGTTTLRVRFIHFVYSL